MNSNDLHPELVPPQPRVYITLRDPIQFKHGVLTPTLPFNVEFQYSDTGLEGSLFSMAIASSKLDDLYKDTETALVGFCDKFLDPSFVALGDRETAIIEEVFSHFTVDWKDTPTGDSPTSGTKDALASG